MLNFCKHGAKYRNSIIFFKALNNHMKVDLDSLHFTKKVRVREAK